MDNSKSLKEINFFLNKDEQELYTILSSYSTNQVEIRELVPEETNEKGEKEFSKIEQILFNKICIEWGYCKQLQKQTFKENENLIIAILDIVSSLTIGFPPTLITAILLKKGLKNFCSCK